MDPEKDQARRADRSRSGFRWGAGLMVLLIVPTLATFVLALIAFGGCFIGCQEPEPLAGALLFAAAIAMLALPFLVASAISRQSRQTWFTAMWVAIAMALCLVVGWSSAF